MSDTLYIFLDEGGTFDFSSTGTKYYIFTSVCMVRPFNIMHILGKYKFDLLESEFNLDQEFFHCAQDNSHVRRRVFGIIKENLSSIKSIDIIITEKRKTGPALQPSHKFYPKVLGYLLRYLLTYTDLTSYKQVIVITDRVPTAKKGQSILKAIKPVLKEMLPSGVPYRILHHESKSNVGLQIADYCNWAVTRKYEFEDTTDYYQDLKPKIKSEFDIFKNGTTYYY